MSIWIIVLIVIGALIIIPFIGGIFVPKQMSISQEIVIHKPVAEIYDFVKYLKNSEQYNKWVMADPNMKKEYLGTDNTVGFVYRWESKKGGVGAGEQEIVALEENKRIDYELRFIKPQKNVAFGGFTFEPVVQGTKVKYLFNGPSNYMMRVMQFALNIKKMLSRDMMSTLTNLKNLMEKR